MTSALNAQSLDQIFRSAHNHGVDRTQSDPKNGELLVSTQENFRNVKDLSPAVGRGDKQGLLALSVEHLEWIEVSRFRDDVLRGLSELRRSVPSRWLYDDRGSELFEEITRLE